MKNNNKNTEQKNSLAKMRASAEYYAFHLQELEKDIQCPQLGYSHYGKLGMLDKRGLLIIDELIKVIKKQDNTILGLVLVKYGK